jgi:hypothetical protein
VEPCVPTKRAIIFKSRVTTASRVLRSSHRQATDETRREQLLASADALANLAKHRSIEPVRPRLVEHDLGIRRMLDTVVRRWSNLVPITYISDSMTNVARRPGTVREHVVPCQRRIGLSEDLVEQVAVLVMDVVLESARQRWSE